MDAAKARSVLEQIQAAAPPGLSVDTASAAYACAGPGPYASASFLHDWLKTLAQRVEVRGRGGAPWPVGVLLEQAEVALLKIGMQQAPPDLRVSAIE